MMPYHDVLSSIDTPPRMGHNKHVPIEDNTIEGGVSSSPDEADPSDISSDIIADRFRDYLISEKGMKPHEATRIADYLEEFIDKNVPEIGAIQSLRQASATLKGTKTYPKYADRASYNMGDDPIAWYDKFYRADVERGLINTSQLSRLDQSFVNHLMGVLRPSGMKLADFMGLRTRPSVKIEALSIVLDSSSKFASSFAQSFNKSGRPPKG